MAEEVREVFAQVGIGEPEEVPLAAETGSVGEDGKGKDLARRQQRRAARLPRRGRMGPLPPFVNQEVQIDEQSFEIHTAPPSVGTLGRRWIETECQAASCRPDLSCRWRGPAVLPGTGGADGGRPTPPRGHQLGAQRGIKALDGVAQHGAVHIARVLLEETYE